MTDPIPNSKINADLALGRGWIQKPAGIHKARWFPPGRCSGIGQPDPPDFCGDINYTWPMLKTLLKPHFANRDVLFCQLDDIMVENECTMEEAIARAAHAILERKKDG